MRLDRKLWGKGQADGNDPKQKSIVEPCVDGATQARVNKRELVNSGAERKEAKKENNVSMRIIRCRSQ